MADRAYRKALSILGISPVATLTDGEKSRADEIAAALREAKLSGVRAVLEMEPTDEMIEAGWIDKEDVNPDDIWFAMNKVHTPEQLLEIIERGEHDQRD